MSVINQVLNDIEQRKKNDLTLGCDKFSALELQEPRSKGVMLLAALAVSGVVFAIVWWFFQEQLSSDNKQVTNQEIISEQVVSQKEPGLATTSAAKGPSVSNDNAVVIESLAEAKTSESSLSNPENERIVANAATEKQPVVGPLVDQKTVIPDHKEEFVVTDKRIEPINARSKRKIITKATASNKLTIQAVELTPVEIATLKFKQGEAQLSQGYLFKAQDLWRESLSVLPSYHQARQRLVQSYIESNSVEHAMAMLLEGIKLFPSYSQFQLIAAQLYLHNQQPEQALAVLDRPYRMSDKSDEIIVFAASLAQQLQQWQQAELNYDVLVARNKNNQKWLMGLAISLDAQAKTQPAITRYSQLISLPDTAAVLVDYAQKRITLLKAQQQRDNNG